MYEDSFFLKIELGLEKGNSSSLDKIKKKYSGKYDIRYSVISRYYRHII